MPRFLSLLLRTLVPLLLAVAMLASPARAQSRGPLVLAAASLQEALTAAADNWVKKGHARPVLSFAASSALARQIEAKAPADLFISADEEWMDYVAQRKLIVPGTRAAFLTNRLVIVAPAGSRVRFDIRPGFPLAAALRVDDLRLLILMPCPRGAMRVRRS